MGKPRAHQQKASKAKIPVRFDDAKRDGLPTGFDRKPKRRLVTAEFEELEPRRRRLKLEEYEPFLKKKHCLEGDVHGSDEPDNATMKDFQEVAQFFAQLPQSRKATTEKKKQPRNEAAHKYLLDCSEYDRKVKEWLNKSSSKLVTRLQEVANLLGERLENSDVTGQLKSGHQAGGGGALPAEKDIASVEADLRAVTKSLREADLSLYFERSDGSPVERTVSIGATMAALGRRMETKLRGVTQHRSELLQNGKELDQAMQDLLNEDGNADLAKTNAKFCKSIARLDKQLKQNLEDTKREHAEAKKEDRAARHDRKEKFQNFMQGLS